MLSPFLKQAWTVSAVLLNMLGQGMLFSYPSCLLPALRAPDSVIQADIHTASWLSSSVALAGIPGFIMSSPLMDIYGRKITHAIVIVPGIVGWSLIYFATNIPMLMIGRILGGVTAGGTVSLGAVVIGEYTSPKHRGMFLNLKTAAVCLGSMVVHIIGHYLHWRTVALVALLPHVAAFIIVFTWPESPAWLASKQEYRKSEKSFLWLRGTSDRAKQELDELFFAQRERHSMTTEKLSFKQKVFEFFKKFTQRNFLKPSLIVLLGSILLEASGRHIFPAYALDIIGEVTGDKSQSFYCTLGIDIIITTSATFSSVLVKVMRRRVLLFGSGIASLVALTCPCTYLFLVSNNIISNDRPWIPVAMFVVYFVLANLGCTPIPLALLGEVFPLSHRGAGSLVSGTTLSLSMMAGLKLTPYLLASVKVHGTFIVLGGIIGISLLGLYYLLPETKDRTLQEIEDFFNDGKFKDSKLSPYDKDVNEKMINT